MLCFMLSTSKNTSEAFIDFLKSDYFKKLDGCEPFCHFPTHSFTADASGRGTDQWSNSQTGGGKHFDLLFKRKKKPPVLRKPMHALYLSVVAVVLGWLVGWREFQSSLLCQVHHLTVRPLTFLPLRGTSL